MLFRGQEGWGVVGGDVDCLGYMLFISLCDLFVLVNFYYCFQCQTGIDHSEKQLEKGSKS